MFSFWSFCWIALASLEIDRTVKEVDWLVPGHAAAMATLTLFAEQKLSGYAADRNDPNKNVASNLSPYFHFGQLSAQRAGDLIVVKFCFFLWNKFWIAFYVKNLRKNGNKTRFFLQLNLWVKLSLSASGTDSFIEESVVRRELADNFCHYNPLYDVLDGCNDWAKEVQISRNSTIGMV